MAGPGHAWHPIGVDSGVERAPSSVPVVPHRGHLELLPLDVLPWPDFESLQWRILRDVEGLAHAQIYGDPGQTQLGLDIIALAADDSGVALQSKRVRNFGPAKITDAVDAFRGTERPFDVSRFIIGVSREIRRREALNRFRELRKELKQGVKPVELELWDKRELSMKLKGAPAIVIDYFGNDVAEAFCDPFTMRLREVPRREVVAIREALARTPDVTTGAGEKISQAKVVADDDPAAALVLVEEAQAALTDAGFAGHAAQYEGLRASHLVAVGRGAEASRRRLDQLWHALEQGSTTLAHIAANEIDTLAGQVRSKAVQDHRRVARRAVQLYANPLASVPSLADLLVGAIDDRARLAVLAGETALAGGNHEWLKKNATRARNLATKLPAGPKYEALRTRLRVLVAEGTGNWSSVLGDARSLKLGYDLGSLVQARHARSLALSQKFEEADASWNEATGNACLAERWTDAARWTLSRRAFRVRWNPLTVDELLPVQTALSELGPDQTVLTRDDDALELGYVKLTDEKLREAAISAQRALRDAVTLSDWEGERRARRLLADVLCASGEHVLAANHLVLAGENSALTRLAADQPARFLDVTPQLRSKPWWVVGAAYALIAKQEDLVPDDLVQVIAASAVADLRAASKGTLVDITSFAGSRYLGAIAVLAGLSERLSLEHADEVLAYFEAQPDVEPHHYRYHDKDEATAVAGIVATYPSLAERALGHLVLLLARSDSSRTAKTHDAVAGHSAMARPLLEKLADAGNPWANEMLNVESPEKVSPTQVQEARSRLEEPLVHTPGVYTVGSGSRARPDSGLVRTLPVKDQQAALAELLDRGADRHVSAPDRADYLVAASNLRPPNNRAKRTEFFNKALDLVIAPPESLADALDGGFQHPLGAVRMSRRRDTRGEAAHLAATLARTRQEKERVRAAAFRLIGDENVAEVWVTRSLQRLGDTMAPDVGFLSGQNWALKSLAAILWAKTTEPAPVGYRLAHDPDVRVRRALATHVLQHQAADETVPSTGLPGQAERDVRIERRGELLELLQQDPCFSVRTAATSVIEGRRT